MHPLPWVKSSFLFFWSESDVWIFLYRETIVTLGFYCLWNNNIHRAVFKSFSLTSQYYFYLLEFSHSPTPCSFLCSDFSASLPCSAHFFPYLDYHFFSIINLLSGVRFPMYSQIAELKYGLKYGFMIWGIFGTLLSLTLTLPLQASSEIGLHFLKSYSAVSVSLFP